MEYRTIRASATELGFGAPGKPAPIDATLTGMAADGWRVVGVLH